VFVYKQTGIVNGVVHGELMPTGLRPRFLNKLQANNIEIPKSIFEK